MKIQTLRLLNILLLLIFIITPTVSAQVPLPEDPRAAGLGEPIDIPPEDIIILQSEPVTEPFLFILEDAPLLTYEGDLEGFSTLPQTGTAQPDLESPQAEAYRQYLLNQQDAFIQKAEELLGHAVQVGERFTLEVNGIILTLLKTEAKQVLQLDGVLGVETVSTNSEPSEQEPNQDLTRQAPLPVTKEVSQQIAEIGDILTYTITIPVNQTGADLTYTIEDVLPAGVTYVPYSLWTSGSEVDATYTLDELTGTETIQWQGIVPNFVLRYDMSDNVSNPYYCKMPFGNGGYFDILTNYFKPARSDIYGDSLSFTSGLLGIGTEFYGDVIPYKPIFTDDGYVLMTESENYEHQVFETNVQIPNLAEPNGLLSMWWRDLLIKYKYDPALGINQGVTPMLFTSAFLVEFDDIEYFWDENFSMDFEVFAWQTPDPEVGFPDIVFAYDNVSSGWDAIGTIGIENPDGSTGLQYAYNNDIPQNGDIVCFDYVEIGRDPVVITFDVTVNDTLVSPENLPGTTITNTAAYSLDGLTWSNAEASFLVNDIPVADPQTLVTDEDVPLEIVLTGSDMYPGEDLIFKITQPLNGKALANPVLPNVIYTPKENWYGTDSFTFTVGDGISTSLPATITIEVLPVNDLPVVDIPDQTILVGESFATINLDDYVADVEDLDAELTWSFSGNINLGVSIDESSRVATITIPDPTWCGEETVTFSATDLEGGIGEDAVTLIVNDVPLAYPQSLTTAEDTPLTMTLTGSDVYPGDTFIYQVTPPQNGTVTANPSFPDLTYTPDLNFFGDDSFTFTVSDGIHTSLPETITIDVSPVNDPPVVEITDLTINEGGSFTSINLDVFVYDVDNLDETLTWTVSGYSELSATIDAVNRIATVTIPHPDWFGAETLTFRATDPDGAWGEDTVTFTVNPVNDAPVISDIPGLTIDEGQAFAPISLDQIVSDVDNLDQELTWTYSGNTQLTVAINLDRVATISVPHADWYGSEMITFKATDPGGLSASKTIQFTVNPVNDPPTAVSDTFLTLENTPLVLSSADLLGNDYDIDSNFINLSLTGVTNPLNGSVDLAAGIVTFTPTTDFSGTAGFDYLLSDGLLTSTGHVTVYVRAVNTAPVVSDIPDQVVPEGGTFSEIHLDAYVTDADNDLADLAWTATGALELTVEISADRVATISIPDINWFGAEDITFRATDPEGLFDATTATFTVTAVNDPPVVGDIPGQTIAEGETFTTIDLNAFVSDVEDPDSAIIWTTSGNNFLTVNIDENRMATISAPDSDWFGSETIIFAATDSSGLTDSDAGTFTVTAVNDPPVFSEIPDQVIDEGGSFAQIILDEHVLDVDDLDEDITWTWLGETDLILSLSSERVLTISTPNLDWNGSETITFTATDLTGAFDDWTTVFTVNAINDPPINIVPSSISILEDSPLSTQSISVNDKDVGETIGGKLQVTLSVNQGHLTLSQTGELTFTAGDGTEDALMTFTGTPADINLALYGMVYQPEVNATDDVTFTILTDDQGFTGSGGALSDQDTMIILIKENNSPPAATEDHYSVDEDLTLTVDSDSGVLANDEDQDGDPLVAELISSPQHGTLILELDGAFTYVPMANYHGGDSFSYQACDGIASSEEVMVNITINPINDPPVVSDIPGQTILEGASFTTLNLDAFVTDVDNSDTEINWSYTGNINLAVSIDSEGVATITPPNPDWNGSETITFTATDPEDFSDSDTATFRVTAVNDPPVVSTIPDQEITEDDTFTPIVLDGYVIDVDNLDAEITWTWSGDSNLLVDISTERVATIIPVDPNWNGSETITFTATDIAGASSSGVEVIFKVTPVNDPPVVSDIPGQTVLEGASFTSIDLDPFVSDVDNEDADINWDYSGTLNLSVNIDTNRVGTITPLNPDWSGSETITFIATDPEGLSDSDIATFRVTAVNDSPVISTIPDQEIAEGGTFTPIPLDGYVNDVDNTDDEITWSWSGASNLFVEISPDRVATIIPPDPNWNGSETITFTAKDPALESASIDVIFTVTPVNDPPILLIIPELNVEEEEEWITIDLSPYVIDVDGNPLSYLVFEGPDFGTLSAYTGNVTEPLTYTPDAGYTGEDTFNIMVNDGEYWSNDVKVTIKVKTSGSSIYLPLIIR